jgi:hypothetical protein
MLFVQSPEDKDKRGESALSVQLDEKLSGNKERFLSKQSDFRRHLQFASVIKTYHCPLFLIYPIHAAVC